MDFKTDMNDRERQRFSRHLREMAKNANEAADALDRSDDAAFATALIILSIQGSGLKEMQEVLLSTLRKDSVKEEFPDTIGT